MKHSIRIFTLLAFLLSCYMSFAQNQEKVRTVTIEGNIMNAFTYNKIDSVLVTLMAADSTVIGQKITRSRGEYQSLRDISYYNFDIPAHPARYIVKAEREGYHTGYTNMEIKKIGRNMMFYMSTIKLRPSKKNNEIGGGNLNEVIVKATRIKMIHRGDTIIFNADAFSLEEGSVLKSLVKQLPGATISSDGTISVNGERIEELTLNGREFFKGNNNVMLENLPNFTVKNIKVYHKSSELSQWLGREVDKKSYVMDVVLMREYNTGHLANIELAGGTENRYLGRLFGLRYTDCSRLSAYANTNNVNEDCTPGQNGDWTPSNRSHGQKKTHTAGIDILIDEKDKRWKEAVNATFNWNKLVDESLTNSETYIPSGNIFGRNRNLTKNRDGEINVKNAFSWYTPVFISSQTNFFLSSHKASGNVMSATTDMELNKWGDVQSSLDSIFASSLSPELQRRLINRNQMNSLTDNRTLRFGSKNCFNFKFSNGDMIAFNVNGSYDNTKNKLFSQQGIDYFRIVGNNQEHNNYDSSPSYKYKYTVDMIYNISVSDLLGLSFKLVYDQSYDKQVHDYFRLDQLSGWGVDGNNAFGSLPSNRNELLQTLDARNSYKGTNIGKEYTCSLSQNWNLRKLGCKFQGSLILYEIITYSYETLNYQNPQLTSNIKQNKWEFNPNYMLMGSIKNHSIMSYGNIQISPPSLYDKVDVINDENPLALRLGNPNLKNTIKEGFTFNMQSLLMKINSLNTVHIDWSAMQNAVSQSYTYNETTGVYSFKPVNVNGNWNIKVSDEINHTLGRHNSITAKTTCGFIQSVDMSSTTGSIAAVLNKVHTTLIGEEAQWHLNYNDFTTNFIGTVTWRHSTSDNENFSAVNAADFSYGFTSTYKISGVNVFAATDMKMYSRRGYSVSDFNRNDLIWNASLSKSFLKGKLTARLEAFDLLHQLTNTSIVINAQGRTETITNTLPRYAMLHISYKFSKTPKKSK